jgi:cytochrome P450
VNDLWRWSSDPISLLEWRDGAGPFTLRLWRKMIVGYGPAWNRAVLGDLDTFRSGGSLSRLTPYLNGGVVQLDQPAHHPRRRELNPHFHSGALTKLADRIAAAAETDPPGGTFDVTGWAYQVTIRMLNAAFFDGEMDPLLLRRFLLPLAEKFPYPFLPRPLLFARMNRAIAARLAQPAPGSLAETLSGVDGAVEEIRVSLAAGFDTTAHTLGWAAWHLAAEPGWADPRLLGSFLDEVLRLYPAGWIGSRVTTRDTTAEGAFLPKRTLVCYSPYLTHRDPDLWPDPLAFRPQRFEQRPAAWTYLPFGFGARTCLGMHLARLMLTTALTVFASGRLEQAGARPGIRAGVTLAADGPLLVSRGRGRLPRKDTRPGVGEAAR